MTVDLVAFAAERDATLTSLAGRLRGPISAALASPTVTADVLDLLAEEFRDAYENEGGTDWRDAYALLRGDLNGALARTTPESDPDRMATWLATALVNRATTLAAPLLSVKQWVTMEDEAVRGSHRVLHGVRRLRGEPFPVNGAPTQYPGQPVGPPENYLNCRCVLAILPFTNIADAFSAEAGLDRRSKVRPNLYAVEGDEMADTDVITVDEDFDVSDYAPDEPTPWYGVLAPEGVLSGDKRSFDPGALSSRDLPLPLLWQPSNESGHDGAVIVGRIDRIERDDDGLVWGEGVFAQTEDADKVVGLIAEGHLRGISVDVDDAEMAVTEDESVRFSKGRISAATIVPIPAFAEAFIALGTRQDYTDLVAAAVAMRDYTRAERDDMAGDEAMEDGSYPIVDAEDLRNAIQAVGRAKDYEAAKRHIIRRARALDLTDLLPKEWAGAVAEYANNRLGYGHGTPEQRQDGVPAGAPLHGGEHVRDPQHGRTHLPDVQAAVLQAPPTSADPVGGAVLAEGGQERARRLLAVDGRPNDPATGLAGPPQVRSHHGGTEGIEDMAGAPARMDAASRTDPRRSDHRPPVSRAAVREPGAPGAGDVQGEHAQDAGGEQTLGRGPGWVTHPKETARLHRYWTSPGQPGYAKIRWGTPGDFTRAVRFLRKYISPAFLYRTAAQFHHDALGYWPGELGKPGNPPNTPENRRRAARHASALEPCDDCAPQGVTLVAAAPPRVLPADAFADPALPGPTALTVGAGGRVWGHLALWDTCHIGIDRMCVTPPRSHAQYAYFATGQVLTDDGYRPVGQITLDTGHADLSSDPFAAKAHYDNTGTVVADVAVGDDEYGIWFAGMLRDDVDEATLHRLMASGLSGDWRGIRGNLELVAALAVNVPGFPVPRLAASGGRQTALITSPAPLGAEQEVTVDMRLLAAAVVDEMSARTAHAHRLHVLREFADEDRRARARALMEVR